MEKIICFFCDITGTLKGRNKNSDLDYKNLASNLLKLMEKTVPWKEFVTT